MNPSRNGLKLAPPEPNHWVLGSGKATARFGSGNINPTGDWTTYKAADEHQSNALFDTECCWIFSSLKPLIMLAKLQGFDDFPKNLAERFIAVMANAQPTGGDPAFGIETVRICGGVIEEMLPFNDSITSWPEWKHPDPMPAEIVDFAKALLDKFVIGWEWVFPYGNKLTPKEKTDLIRQAALRGAVAYSVDGNYRTNGKGQLTKKRGGRDSHWVTHLNVNADGTKTFHDQYDPFIQTLAKDYDHNAAIVYFLKRKEPAAAQSFWDSVWAVLADHFRRLWSGS